MQQAMEQVKRELGANAVILQTRTVPRSLFGLFPRKSVEITAAADVPNIPAQAETPREAKPILPPASTGMPAEMITVSRLNSLEDKISKLTSTVEALLEKSLDRYQFSGDWNQLLQYLVLQGMEESLARGVVEDFVRSGNSAQEVLEKDDLLARYFEPVICAKGGIQLPAEGQKIVVLIGPTGVGKTTTLAKIAANFLKEGRRIAFLTADTYRLAAVEQLQKYADIMGLSLDTVYSPEEMGKAIARHADKELIFVDTAGRSQRNSGQMEELKAFVAACQPAEVHLLLGATTKREDLEEILERFSICPIDCLILTKTDESSCFGPFYSIIKRNPIPFSYITTGQNVPEDIEEATACRIAGLISGKAQESEGLLTGSLCPEETYPVQVEED